MDKADQDFLHQLFRENNDLRNKVTALQREIYNRTVQIEATEDEIRQLRENFEAKENNGQLSRPTTEQILKKPPKVPTPEVANTQNLMSKELEEAVFALDRKINELKQTKEELLKTQQQLEHQKATSEESTITSDDMLLLKQKLESAQETITQQKQQIMEIAMDANRKHNEQQSQLQGVEALIEGVRREYDEFIQITKLENDQYRSTQQAEYENLRSSFEQYKMEQFEEKKKLMAEYQSVLYSVQTQFDEYRATSELLLNTEMAKLEDELSSQAMRYEHEIMYIIQAKDKFYADMMVSKDAKIMSLIEGSDLQNLIQKHEMDMENARKEHAREIERVKSDQETEQKNLIVLLQRQNVSLETKCEKLQQHMKTMETRIKELLSAIESKNKQIAEKEELRGKMESEFMRKIDELNSRISNLTLEKEHLRHKIIRLNLDAKGEGENTIENMLKRISRETTDLYGEFTDLAAKYDLLLTESQNKSKKLLGKDKLIEFLEKEIDRRSEEFSSLTKTFEEFLVNRSKQNRKNRANRLLKIYGVSDEGKVADDKLMDGAKTVLSTSMNGKTLVKAHIPPPVESVQHPFVKGQIAESENTERTELERGYAYLRRFKTLSKAFATGQFRSLPSSITSDKTPGPWQKIALYNKIEEASTATRLYSEQIKDESFKQIPHPKPLVYHPETVEIKNPKPKHMLTEVKLYEEIPNNPLRTNSGSYKRVSGLQKTTPTKPTKSAQSNPGSLVVGGTPITATPYHGVSAAENAK